MLSIADRGRSLRLLLLCLLSLLLLSAPQAASAQLIQIVSPAYRADVHGSTRVAVAAAGFRSPLTVRSWLPGGRFGADSTVASVSLDAAGSGSFELPAEQYPHGPITVRVSGVRVKDGDADTCYLQLFNTGGVRWNEGIPQTTPRGAAGLSLVFHDDFDGPLSISRTGETTRYAAHKPDGLDFSGIPFSDPGSAGPFRERDGYLILEADQTTNTTGLLSSVDIKGKGFSVKPPFYMECRFLAPDAIGTWPAWWAISDSYKDGKWDKIADEIDTIEAYGGDGPKTPNAPRSYQVTPHTWGYQAPEVQEAANNIDMTRFGSGAGWADTPHTYGLLVTRKEFVFYLDDAEILRLPATPVSKHIPMYFMVNLAVGGNGWPVDLSRYGGAVDMYVDYITVYH